MDLLPKHLRRLGNVFFQYQEGLIDESALNSYGFQNVPEFLDSERFRAYWLATGAKGSTPSSSSSSRPGSASEVAGTELPPAGMTARMERFDFREGGGYRMRLTYDDPSDAPGKSSADADDVEVRLVRLVRDRRIEQEVMFESDDPRFAGVMRMTWTFSPVASGTEVTVRAEDVPEGIRPEDHVAGLASTLENLAGFMASR